MNQVQPSHDTKGGGGSEGRKLRRARNIVKRWDAGTLPGPVGKAKYLRAMSLLVRKALER